MGKKNFPLWFYLLWAALDALLRFWWLFIIGIILMIAGIYFRPCLFAGVGVLLLDVCISVIGQMKRRSVMMKESESLEFTEFQETVFNGEDPVDSVKAFAEEKISNADEK